MRPPAQRRGRARRAARPARRSRRAAATALAASRPARPSGVLPSSRSTPYRRSKPVWIAWPVNAEEISGQGEDAGRDDVDPPGRRRGRGSAAWTSPTSTSAGSTTATSSCSPLRSSTPISPRGLGQHALPGRRPAPGAGVRSSGRWRASRQRPPGQVEVDVLEAAPGGRSARPGVPLATSRPCGQDRHLVGQPLGLVHRVRRQHDARRRRRAPRGPGPRPRAGPAGPARRSARPGRPAPGGRPGRAPGRAAAAGRR